MFRLDDQNEATVHAGWETPPPGGGESNYVTMKYWRGVRMQWGYSLKLHSPLVFRLCGRAGHEFHHQTMVVEATRPLMQFFHIRWQHASHRAVPCVACSLLCPASNLPSLSNPLHAPWIQPGRGWITWLMSTAKSGGINIGSVCDCLLILWPYFVRVKFWVGCTQPITLVLQSALL